MARGYTSYRGKRPFWKVVAAVLLILVILLACGAMALQKYVVYDADGRPRLELPQKQQPETPDSSAGTPPSQEDLNLTVEKNDQTPETLWAVQLPEGDLAQWRWAEDITPALESADSNALVVTVKGADGQVCYDSPAAKALTGQSGVQQLSAVTERLKGKYTIARLSCFLDPLAAKAEVETMGLKNTGGYVFYDGNNLNWLDPAKPAAREYLVSLAKECADAGFQELLLTNVSYPTEGKLNKIDYGETMKNENLVQFLTELKAALAGTDVKLALELPAETVLSGMDPNAGLVLADLAPLVSRIVVPADAAQTAALEQAVTAAGAGAALTVETADVSGITGSYLLLRS